MVETRPETVADANAPAQNRSGLFRRRLVTFLAVFLICVIAAATTAVARTPYYESRCSIVPIDQADLIRNWLYSLNASAVVTSELENRLGPVLFPRAWDVGSGTWLGTPPSQDRMAQALRDHVRLRIGAPETQTATERYVEVIASFQDPILAKDVATAYLRTLDKLRPVLENITRQEATDRYYSQQFTEGSQEEATSRAETYARERIYWIVLDAPALPTRSAGPGSVAILIIGASLGLLLGALSIPAIDLLDRARRKAD